MRATKVNIDDVVEYLSLHLPFGKGRDIVNKLNREFKTNHVNTILDVGCGCGKFSIFRNYESVGCDIFPLSIEMARKNGNYKKVYLLDINNLPFGDKSFDAVTCIDVVEHLNKEDSIKLIEKMEKIARKVVFIQTPWGYDHTYKAGYFLGVNPYMKHLCGWTPEEFNERGYKTEPALTIRPPFGGAMGALIGYIEAVVLRPFIIRYPKQLCSDFIAVKRGAK
jgi:SAM-dependent methyltransferase